MSVHDLMDYVKKTAACWQRFFEEKQSDASYTCPLLSPSTFKVTIAVWSKFALV
jgi:hypothetical protein